ncbi:MAG: tetratricopeptide repeat protein [Vampirovibrio sp.]
MQDYNKAIELGENDNWIYNRVAYAYDQLQQYDKALDAYSKAIELDPENAWAYTHRANVYTQLKQEDKALADIEKSEKLLAKDNDTPVILKNKTAYTKRIQTKKL